MKVSDGNNGQNQRWVQTKVVVRDHIVVPKIKPQNIETADAFLEDYVSDLMKIPLDTSRPLWELHLLNLKTSDAENVAVLKIHHSVGDGMSIMSLVLACMRKTSNPDELPSLPSASSRLTTGLMSSSRLWWLIKVIWTAVMLVLNTVSDAFEFFVTTLFLKDTKTPIKGDFLSMKKSKALRLVHRTVSLDDIKLIKNAMKMVCYIKYPRVRNRDDPWVTVTRLNPRGRVQGSSELEDPLQPSTSGNLSAAEDLAGVGLVVDLTDFGEEAVVHVEDEPVIGEFHEDPDSDSSGDDDSETDYH
uniref:diacylglycerol O-acyltransferase n=1 Tax=Brassica oleracea var. oleracea TaxID=109376 RepID=A0A0D3BG45_BRAOL